MIWRSNLRATALVLALVATAQTGEIHAQETGSKNPAEVVDEMPWPVGAAFEQPTEIYPHNIMGSIRPSVRLAVTLMPCRACTRGRRTVRITLPDTRVFEDIAPHLWDVTGDGRPEIVTVESDLRQGSRLTIWELAARIDGANVLLNRRASSPFLGTRFRWLALIGTADFTGDSVPDIAYVEKPHRDKILRLVTLKGNELVEIASLDGVTNHSVGDETVTGGIRDCAGRNEVVALSADRAHVLVIQFERGNLVGRKLESQPTASTIAAALDCRE